MKYQRVILYFAYFTSSILAAAVTIILGWLGLRVGGEVASVGQLLAIYSLVGIVVGPLAGVLIDRSSRRVCLILGTGLAAITTAAIAWRTSTSLPLQFWHLAIGTSFLAISFYLIYPVLDSLLHAATPVAQRRELGAQIGILRQLGLMAGATTMGLAITYLSEPAALLITAMVAVLILSIALFTIEDNVVAADKRVSPVIQLLEGLKLLCSRRFATISLTIVCSWSIGQATNAVLPGRIRELGYNSLEFGISDSCWSMGGLAVAIYLSKLLQSRMLWRTELWGVALLGFLTAVFSQATSPLQLYVLHALMGASFATAKIVADARLLEACNLGFVGRVRSNIMSVTSFTGVGVFLLPSIVPSATPGSVYLGFGVGVLSVAFIMLYYHYYHVKASGSQ